MTELLTASMHRLGRFGEFARHRMPMPAADPHPLRRWIIAAVLALSSFAMSMVVFAMQQR